MTSVLITGGAGFIGSRLACRIAQDSGCEVRVVDNLSRGRRRALIPAGRRVRFIQADIRDRSAMNAAVKGVEIVFHLGAVSNVLGAETDPDNALSSNVTGTFEVLRASRNAGVRRVVFASSREVYGDPSRLPVSEDTPLAPKNNYGAGKASAEMLCRYLGSDTAILRFANVYGPGDRGRVIPIFAARVVRHRDLVLYGGAQIVDFVWIGQVVEALIRAASGPPLPGPVNIGSGVGTTIADLAARIVALANSRSRIVVEPARSVEVARFVADTSRAASWLGLSPQRTRWRTSPRSWTAKNSAPRQPREAVPITPNTARLPEPPRQAPRKVGHESIASARGGGGNGFFRWSAHFRGEGRCAPYRFLQHREQPQFRV